MKRPKFKFIILLCLVALLFLIMYTVYPIYTASTYENTEVEAIINQYVDSIKSNKWKAYVGLFNYDEDVKKDLLLFLKDSKNQAKKEGIHGIEDIKLVSIKLSTDPEFISKGDYVYEVLLDMKVHKASEFYMNGVTRHIFVFKRTNGGLKIETVYFKGLADKDDAASSNNIANSLAIKQ